MCKINDIKVTVVVVTYNRLDKLKKTLSSYDNQVRKPYYMIIVDNASTDGTAEWLSKWKKKSHEFEVEIITSEKNLGGSGGFYLGQERAMQLNTDWIMISDDDAYPDNNYIKGLVEYIATNSEENISIVCGAVKQENSLNEHTHRAYRKKNPFSLSVLKSVPKEDYKKNVFYPQFVSYVGILISKSAMKKAGLVDKDRFIWCDDSEHSYRLSKYGKIACIPHYVILHDIAEARKKLTWKTYYGCRNWLVFHKEHSPKTFIPAIIYSIIRMIAVPIKGNHMLEEIKMRCVAMKDAIYGNMGMNDVYKPGWKP